MAIGVAAAIMVLNSVAFAQIVNVSTEKTVYLMDPYYWVYEAARVSPYWPQGGYERTVNFTVRTFDDIGKITNLGSLSYRVLDGLVLLTSGSLWATGDPGVYKGTFQLGEDDVGRDLFTGQKPKELTLQILNSSNLSIRKQKLYVGRWGCDRCHVAPSQARRFYSWCNPTGNDIGGPHSWQAVLGGVYGSGFDGSTLTDATKVHSPQGLLTESAGHEKTLRKQGGVEICSPCHQGSGRVRHDFDYIPGQHAYPWVAHARSEAVECTFCHHLHIPFKVCSTLLLASLSESMCPLARFSAPEILIYPTPNSFPISWCVKKQGVAKHMYCQITIRALLSSPGF